jgi:hypothetical protein
MAPRENHTDAELANRLEEHADDLTESTSHEAESIVRIAAERLRCRDDQAPLVRRLSRR